MLYHGIDCILSDCKFETIFKLVLFSGAEMLAQSEIAPREGTVNFHKFFILMKNEDFFSKLGLSKAQRTGCPRKFVPRLPEDHDKAAKGRHHILA